MGLILPRRRLILAGLAMPAIVRAQPFPGILMKQTTTAPVAALVAHTKWTSSPSPTINTTGATFLVMAVSVGSGSASAPSDSKSNTWTLLTSDTGASAPDVFHYYAANPTVGSGHTFSANGSASFPASVVAAFSGVVTSTPNDVSNHARGAGTTTLATGSVTPTTAKSLLIATVGNSISATFTIGSGFTIADQQSFGAGLNYGCGMAYLVQAGTAAQNPTWTASLSGNMGATIGVFKST